MPKKYFRIINMECKSKKVMSHGLMVGRSSVDASQSNVPLFPFRQLSSGKKVVIIFFFYPLFNSTFFFVVTAFSFLCKIIH